MITVTITMNGRVIYARTAADIGCKGDVHLYHVDTDELLEHKPDDGVVSLAKMMLDTIHEQKKAKL